MRCHKCKVLVQCLTGDEALLRLLPSLQKEMSNEGSRAPLCILCVPPFPVACYKAMWILEMLGTQSVPPL